MGRRLHTSRLLSGPATMTDVRDQMAKWNITEAQGTAPLLQTLGHDIQVSLWTSLRQVAPGHRNEESISRPRNNSSHVSEIYVP